MVDLVSVESIHVCFAPNSQFCLSIYWPPWPPLPSPLPPGRLPSFGILDELPPMALPEFIIAPEVSLTYRGHGKPGIASHPAGIDDDFAIDDCHPSRGGFYPAGHWEALDRGPDLGPTGWLSLLLARSVGVWLVCGIAASGGILSPCPSTGPSTGTASTTTTRALVLPPVLLFLILILLLLVLLFLIVLLLLVGGEDTLRTSLNAGHAVWPEPAHNREVMLRELIEPQAGRRRLGSVGPVLLMGVLALTLRVADGIAVALLRIAQVLAIRTYAHVAHQLLEFRRAVGGVGAGLALSVTLQQQLLQLVGSNRRGVSPPQAGGSVLLPLLLLLGDTVLTDKTSGRGLNVWCRSHLHLAIGVVLGVHLHIFLARRNLPIDVHLSGQELLVTVSSDRRFLSSAFLHVHIGHRGGGSRGDRRRRAHPSAENDTWGCRWGWCLQQMGKQGRLVLRRGPLGHPLVEESARHRLPNWPGSSSRLAPRQSSPDRLLQSGWSDW
ncbi:uncharacterized protein HMPREF1120_04638 [Exophiala dermatitidis NIH/UT8656]|uniref:Uncharacterized protein n=1 Tax=Exophiala dermatitidis (strain ATCC 34100 / CBS 525.76 / NIH/UT8656) TaxID=858893 RepID=H6BXN3_EXODN|nr:uncharacterized protein HMPREF1120_04638 [Exophiala dermatitidis NIH/UT8656]EHY56560.1 hypothetical protein HMPREF1120_04638 [Exophiala dermatitidis NIH/UT8656]